MVDLATEQEVKRMLDARGLSQSNAGETMVVHVSQSFNVVYSIVLLFQTIIKRNVENNMLSAEKLSNSLFVLLIMMYGEHKNNALQMSTLLLIVHPKPCVP